LKKLREVLPSQIDHQLYGSSDIFLNGIHLDSRKIENGDAFVAIKGLVLDGHDFIEMAIQRGAVVIVTERSEVYDGVTTVQTKDSNRLLGWMASAFYDHPSRQLKLIGVTGTNGKTTITTMMFDLFQELGYKVGLISTIENKIHQEVLMTERTTPDAVSLNEVLAKMVDAACDYVFMEVSSHAIHQRRIAGQTFTGGVFSNLSRDHLDYHDSYKEYIDVKKKFFDLLDDNAFALTNVDDKHGQYLVQNTKATTYRYSLRTLVDYKTKVLGDSLEGLHLSINDHEVYTMFTGLFNAYNITAVYAVADILGVPEGELLQAISRLSAAEGRFDVIVGQVKRVFGVIDYAHTPDAVKNITSAIRKVMKKGRLITVIGCGGSRDKGKRPLMANLACQYSDQVILTSDNPRDEDPNEILEEMDAGVREEDQDKVLIIVDRRQAIKTAVKMSQEYDVVLVAGKGHEKYQEIKGKKIPFDDKLVLKAYLL